MLKATVLSDNNAKEGLEAEWGLSLWIEYGEHSFLLDTGATDLFIRNAEKLGIPVEKAECAVISHAHYDHGGGLEALFERIPGIKAYLRAPTGEYCYHKKEGVVKYIGLPKGILKKYAGRTVFAEGDAELFPGVYLIPHKTENLKQCGKREKMFIRKGLLWAYDGFAHEQSLVVRTDRGLVIFNSCSHGGVANIVREVEKTFPGESVYGMVGGFHLYNKTDKEIRALAESIRQTGMRAVYTGHCTKEKGLALLKEELGDTVQGFFAGCVMEF